MLFGGGLPGIPVPRLVLRAEVNGVVFGREKAANLEPVSFEPAVDLYLAPGNGAARVRATGGVGVTGDAPDRGVGGSVVLTLQP